MVGSPTPPSAETPLNSEAAACLAVAYSGGRDSTALLHATLKAARGQNIKVVAFHVHHGLSAHADEWVQHGEAQCARWAKRIHPVQFVVSRLSSRPSRGESVEAWARTERYRALQAAAELHGASVILLGHHQRDQAETFLLQALRGAGVAGLAGMAQMSKGTTIASAAQGAVPAPALVPRDRPLIWLRPWLEKPHAAIVAYVHRHRLTHIVDDSNTDSRFARNRLRLQVMPALNQAFPQAESSLADATSWAQEAAQCLAELAALDLAVSSDQGGLNLRAWVTLSPARRSNALRAWLKAQAGRPPPASLVKRLMVELPKAKSAQWPMEGAHLRAYRGTLTYRAGAAIRPAPARSEPESTLSVSRAGRYALPGWGGTLQVSRVREGGVPMAWLGHLELRARQGNEQFQAAMGRPARSLKKQYQAAAVHSAARTGPLVFSGGQLVYVAGLGIDARVLALPGQEQMTMEWLPSSG